MTSRPTIQIPGDAVNDAPTYRYWGTTKPPKNAAVLCAVNPTVSADEPTKATLRIYGPIDSWGGYWGVSSRDVAQALDGLGDEVTEIQLRINSGGGMVFEGLAILNLLRAHPAKVTAVVDGLAASAASYIFAGCDERVMSPGTQLMIHDPWSSAWGCDAAEMRKAADTLDKIGAALAELYADVAGGTAEAWRALMVEETWYTAKEAVASSLADRVAVVPNLGAASTAGDDEPDPLEDDDLLDHIDLSVFNYAGRDNAPAPTPPSASAVGSVTTPSPEGSNPVADISDEQLATLRKDLGLKADADIATIVAAVTEVAAEAEPTPVESSVVPEGHVVIPAAKLADLEAGAALATQTATSLHNKERDAFLDSVRTKYLPANRAAWAAEYDRDQKATREHFDKAPVLIPTAEVGHASEPEADDITNAALGEFALQLGLTEEALRG